MSARAKGNNIAGFVLRSSKSTFGRRRCPTKLAGYLAYRDLPEIISNHVTGNQAIDFGCGTGGTFRKTGMPKQEI
ncbi:MAG: hypothetical protein NTV31_05395 [Bacteroidia bacterium]|nr:hypothetical protein [Bacteroidia bacterium]